MTGTPPSPCRARVHCALGPPPYSDRKMAVLLAARRVALGSQNFCRCGQSKVLVARRSFSPMAWYNAQLQKSPVLTKSITSGGESSCNRIVWSNHLLKYLKEFCQTQFCSNITHPMKTTFNNCTSYLVALRTHNLWYQLLNILNNTVSTENNW